MNVLKSFPCAHHVANTDTRTIHKCFEIKGKGNHILLTAEKLKDCTKSFVAEEIQKKASGRANKSS